jgi:hypothetical protein
MEVPAFEALLQQLGSVGIARGKKLRHVNDPPTVYFNWKRSGEVYFSVYRADADLFPASLWPEIAAQQEKNSRDELMTVPPIDGRETQAFEDLLTRTRIPPQRIDDRAATPRAGGIPSGITRDDVLRAIVDLDAAGVDNRFGESRLWDVLENGKLYPPKRVIGIAARRLAGHILAPADFSGGEESECHPILEDLGFHIVPKGFEITDAVTKCGHVTSIQNRWNSWYESKKGNAISDIH